MKVECFACGHVSDSRCGHVELKIERDQLRAEVERLKDQGETACELFDHLKKSQGQVRDLERMLREAVAVVEGRPPESPFVLASVWKTYLVALKRISAPQKDCRECHGTGEIGLADGEVWCPTCHPEFYKKKA